MPITVVNAKGYKGRGIYIGRSGDPKDAVFGNPYTHLPLEDTLAQYQVSSRAEAIQRYRDEWIPKQWAENRYFRLALSSLVRAYLRGEDIVLACHCKPDKTCHGDVLKELIEQMAFLGVYEPGEDDPF